MSKEELLPFEGLVTYKSITLFQRKIGSILFAAINTRSNVAFATTRLARFCTNPSDIYYKAADRVLRYLCGTHTMALRLEGGDDFIIASDALYADNTLNRKSL